MTTVTFPPSEVDQDPNRVWCPRPGCDTACTLPPNHLPFTCPGCSGRFCSICRLPREDPERSPHECRPERWLLGGSQLLGGAVKRCPHCGVMIEREEGCAQMLCRRCRHTFCWYCLASLDVSLRGGGWGGGVGKGFGFNIGKRKCGKV